MGFLSSIQGRSDAYFLPFLRRVLRGFSPYYYYSGTPRSHIWLELEWDIEKLRDIENFEISIILSLINIPLYRSAIPYSVLDGSENNIGYEYLSNSGVALWVKRENPTAVLVATHLPVQS